MLSQIHRDIPVGYSHSLFVGGGVKDGGGRGFTIDSLGSEFIIVGGGDASQWRWHQTFAIQGHCQDGNNRGLLLKEQRRRENKMIKNWEEEGEVWCEEVENEG